MENLLFDVPAQFDHTCLAQMRLRRDKLEKALKSKKAPVGTRTEYHDVSNAIERAERKELAAALHQ